MKRHLFVIIFTIANIFSCEKEEIKEQKPTLVVGIVVDQMRFDYLTKYAKRYSPDGFKKFLNKKACIQWDSNWGLLGEV